MRVLYQLLVITLLSHHVLAAHQLNAEIEDNEFAEFEEFEEDEEREVPEEIIPEEVPADKEDADDDEAVVEDEENGFEHFQDDEEFEGLDGDKPSSSKSGRQETPKITIAKVPIHFRTNWDSFYLEILMIAGILVYFLNFIAGKSKNQKLAQAWFNSHRSLLEQNFALVGDDGKTEIVENGLIKESENIYSLWCSGRTCCEGMLVELKFIKRQDLVAVVSQLMRPGSDKIHIKVQMNYEDMDTFVFCAANKKAATKQAREMTDISTYCPERKSGERVGLPSTFSLLYENGEVASAILDPKVVAVINKYSDLVEYIHMSDQYSGIKQPDNEGQPTKLPEVNKVLLFTFNLPEKSMTTVESMENLKPLLQMVFHCIDKVKRLRLSREAKLKADRNRQRVQEAFLKMTHSQRAEAAAARREEKRRVEKERIMEEDDPDKQRRWEDREHRRQMKKRQPKMKQLKVKAL